MILLSIFVTALLVGGFAFGIIHVITKTNEGAISELLSDNKSLISANRSIESRIESLCNMLEVQDKLLQEALEPGHQIEVVEPKIL